jgi:hypothetical protein
MADLGTAIGAEPPAEFGVLAETDRAALGDAVERAARARSAQIDHAIDDSLRYMPALLRGAVKRALGM